MRSEMERLLRHPLTEFDPVEIERRRTVKDLGDRMLVKIVAVDR